MLPFTHTIKGKIIVYVYFSLIVFIGIMVFIIILTKYHTLKDDAERMLTLQIREVAEKINAENSQAVATARTLADVQESTGIFSRRNRSVNLLRQVLIDNTSYIDAYYCYEPNADGIDSAYLVRPDAYLSAVDSSGRFLPTWVRDLDDSDSLRLTVATGMDVSLYYQGVKVRFESQFQKDYHQPGLEISSHYAGCMHNKTIYPLHEYFITEPYMYEGKYMVEYVHPIIIDGEFKGVAGVDRTLESLNNSIFTKRKREGEDFILVSRMGRIVATTIPSIPIAEPIEKTLPGDILSQLYVTLRNDKTKILTATDPLDGDTYYFTGTQIEYGHWLVVSRVKQSEILASIYSQILATVIVAFIGMLALFPILIFIANSISKPIAQAKSIAEEISNGNLDAPIPEHSDYDDTGALLHSLETMSKNIRELITFKQLTVTISTMCINAHHDTINDVITRSMKMVGEFISADRGYLMQYNAPDNTIVYTHLWNESDADITIELHKHYPTEFVPYTLNQLFSGQPVIIDSPTELPKEGEIERMLMERIGIQSYIMVPIMFSDTFDGAILYMTIGRIRHWKTKHVELLRIITNIFLTVLNRMKREIEIQDLNKDLENRISQRTEQLQQANRELEAFSYSVSHDLRTPLRHVDGFSEMLAKRVASRLDEKEIGYLRKISDASRYMGQLIDDLLVFSRMGRMEMIRTHIDVSSLVHDTIDELSIDIKNRDVSFTVGDIPAVWGDPSMIRLVFMNLLSNAVKFTRTREHANIWIEGSELNGDVVVKIADNGVGFDPSYTHKLFGVFERLHTQAEFEGTGIGLANIKRIITRHGGRVWAEGRLNQGATFYFSIPAKEGM